jgi:hypothetical protein
MEKILLAIYFSLAFYGICWGPPGPPPSTPVATPEAMGITAALIAGYGIWKRRR